MTFRRPARSKKKKSLNQVVKTGVMLDDGLVHIFKILELTRSAYSRWPAVLFASTSFVVREILIAAFQSPKTTSIYGFTHTVEVEVTGMLLIA